MRKILIAKYFDRVVEAIVDENDYEELNKYKWSSISSPTTCVEYACRGASKEELLISYPKVILMHRQILGLILSSLLIDHTNTNGLDNRRENLRVATKSQNGINTGKKEYSFICSSAHKGVCWNKRMSKWQAQIRNKRKFYYLGCFINEEDAALAYNNKAIELFGEFAKLNNI